MDGSDPMGACGHQGLPTNTLASHENNTITVVISDLSTIEAQSEGLSDEPTTENKFTSQLSKQDNFDISLNHDEPENGKDSLSSNICQNSGERICFDQNEQYSIDLDDVFISKVEDCYDTIADQPLKQEDDVNNQSQP